MIDMITNLVAALLGGIATYLAVRLKNKARQRALDRAVRRFFGFPGKVVIVHSAILDTSEGVSSYSYPATDTRAARTLTRLFESAGLREGRDFTVHADRADRSLPEDKLSEMNLILLCGPARNSVFDKLSAILSMRYSMAVGTDGKNVLKDGDREETLRSSREKDDTPNGPGYDWGLIASLPRLNNPSKRIVILAGIHGTGTVGATEFVADLNNLRILDGRRDGETISEVIRVDYDSKDIETPTRIRLV